jgi:hypothetical protein
VIVNGVDFGMYAIADEDWDFIYSACVLNQYQTVTEFGAGASTVLFGLAELRRIIAVETDDACADRVRQFNMSNIVVVGPNAAMRPSDLVFVDGPFISKERVKNIKAAAVLALKGVILHDSHEPWILEWGAEYLASNGFTQVEFGGSKYAAQPPGAAPYENRYRCTHWRKP